MEIVMAIILGIGWFLIIAAVFIWLLKILVQLLSDLKRDVRMAFITNEGDIGGFFDDLSDAATTLLLIGLWFIGLFLLIGFSVLPFIVKVNSLGVVWT